MYGNSYRSNSSRSVYSGYTVESNADDSSTVEPDELENGETEDLPENFYIGLQSTYNNGQVHFRNATDDLDAVYGVLPWETPYRIIYADGGCNCNLKRSVPTELRDNIDYNNWKEVHRETNAICKEANDKLRQLFWIVLRNPYMPLRWKCAYLLWSSINVIGNIDSIGTDYCVPTVLLPFVDAIPNIVYLSVITAYTLLVLYVLIPISYVLLFMFDIVIAVSTYNFDRSKEKEWILKQLHYYEELDADNIHQCIVDGFAKIIDKLNIELSGLDVYLYESTLIHRVHKRKLYFQAVGIQIDCIEDSPTGSVTNSNDSDTRLSAFDSQEFEIE